MTWVGLVVALTLGHLAMEVMMKLHVYLMCVVEHAAAWGQGGELIRASSESQ